MNVFHRVTNSAVKSNCKSISLAASDFHRAGKANSKTVAYWMSGLVLRAFDIHICLLYEWHGHRWMYGSCAHHTIAQPLNLVQSAVCVCGLVWHRASGITNNNRPTIRMYTLSVCPFVCIRNDDASKSTSIWGHWPKVCRKLIPFF